jgi:invasion protein IalB
LWRIVAFAALSAAGGASAATLNVGGGAEPRAESAQLQQSAPERGAPTARLPEHTEAWQFDNWLVTCQEFADAPKKRVCNAVLRAQTSGNSPVVFTWTMYINDKKQFVGVLQTPPGVLLSPGIEMELGSTKDAKKQTRGPKYKFVYESCGPSWCAATLNFDDALIREAMSAGAANVLIQSSDGSTVRFDFPIKGFDKAYAQLKANSN